MTNSDLQRPPVVYPGTTWETHTPEQVGLTSAKLDELRDLAGGRGCVVRHGPDNPTNRVIKLLVDAVQHSCGG